MTSAQRKNEDQFVQEIACENPHQYPWPLLAETAESRFDFSAAYCRVTPAGINLKFTHSPSHQLFKNYHFAIHVDIHPCGHPKFISSFLNQNRVCGK